MGKLIMLQVLALLCCIIFFFVPVSCTNNRAPGFNTPINIRDSVQVMAAAIARDLSNEGPKAWLHYFAKTPGFFMASDGKLAFPDYKHAADFINNTLVKKIDKIELQWSSIRIDSLAPDMATMAASYTEEMTGAAGLKGPFNGYFTGLIQHTGQGWQLRNLHWSVESGISF